MKKKIGSIEILGFIGLVVWILNNLIRNQFHTVNPILIFIMGIIPNIGAAWFALALGKFIVQYLFKKPYSLQIHLFICIGILAVALAYEIYYHSSSNFYRRPFDVFDMLATLLSLAAATWLSYRSKHSTFSPQSV